VENVQFEFKQAAIQSKCADKIAKLVTWMNANPQVAIGLDGHVDDAQANDNDPTLSARRVSAVRQTLITAGIAPSRISSGDFGTRAPLCRDFSENCLSLNRRVEILAALR
jgi:peptidoglycan-associated lipoprotein